MKSASIKLVATCAAVAMLLAACGGGGGSGNSSQAPGSTNSAQIVGTAATGAAMANAPVTITNSAGASPCVETSITTSGLGSYVCTLKSGETAPFFIVVTDPTGNGGALVSIATTTPAAGASLTMNATPLTTAIVAQLSADGNALSVVNSKTVDAAALKTVTQNVVAQLAQVLAAIGVPDGYDPFTTSITAATAGNTGNTADLVLDVVRVVTDPGTGKLALTTVDHPTPVVLATATTAGGSVPQPDANVASLSKFGQLLAEKLTGCLAVATADRVLAKTTTIAQNQGGSEVDSVGPACADFVADSGNAAGVDFLHNGFSAGQFFYGLLTSDSNTGAKFSVPEVMAFYPKSALAASTDPEYFDRAIINIRFIDGANNPGSIITVAARIPGSSTAAHATEWWMVGNQQEVDVAVRLNLRRTQQMNPSNTNNPSVFQTGVNFNINAKGPGSVRNGNALTLARVSGPGLPGYLTPGGGIVYKVSAGTQNSMDLFNKTGSLTVGSLCGDNGNTVNCPNLWFSHTAGITGSAATTLGPNPPGLLWAQAIDSIDPAQFVKGAKYKVELFYGANTGTADLVLTKTLLSDLIPATMAVNLPWNTPGARLLAALDPAGSLAGAQNPLTVDWVQNLAAPQISSMTASVAGASFGPSRNVPMGATTATYSGLTVPAFTASSARTILLSYRQADSINRSAVYTYN